MRLAGKVAVVTGGGKGIGRVVARTLAEAGARLVVNYAHDAEAADETARLIVEAGGEAMAVAADVSDGAAVRALAEAALGAYGRLDVWMNNAGVDVLTGATRALPVEEKLRQLLAVDVMGSFHGTRAAAAAMGPEGGSVINVAWDHVLQGYPTDYGVLFGASKGGVLGMSTSFARQLAPAVRVNIIAPGFIKTAWGETGVGATVERKIIGMTPLARWGLPEDIAAAALFLASDESRFITGQVLAVNGGVTMG